MDDIVVRSRYPRHSIPAKRRSRYGKDKSNLPKLIARQVAVCILIFFVVFLVKSINTPFTNFITGQVRYVLEQNLELNNIFRSVDNELNKLRGNAAINKSESTGGTGAAKTTEAPSDYTADGAGQDDAIPESSVLSASTEEGSDLPVNMVTPVKGVLSSGFGERKDPITQLMKMHEGIDIEAANGGDIVAALEGTVIETGSSPTYGKYIKLRHNNDLETVYAHASAISAVQGKKVAQGEVIAKVGNTGVSVGAHLHFEVWRAGKAVNPLEYISVPLP